MNLRIRGITPANTVDVWLQSDNGIIYMYGSNGEKVLPILSIDMLGDIRIWQLKDSDGNSQPSKPIVSGNLQVLVS